MTAPGIKLNNPGHIRHSKDHWQGAATDQPHPSFVKFIAPEWGVRAIARLMLTYNRQGRKTVRAIISRYAPPKENKTESYVDFVAARLDVGADDPLTVDSMEVMRPLVRAIIYFEIGSVPYSDAVICEGLRLAGVKDAKPKPLHKDGGVLAQVVSGAAVCCAAVSQVAEPVKKTADSLADFTGAPIISQIVTGLLTVAGVATLAGLAAAYLKKRKGL